MTRTRRDHTPTDPPGEQDVAPSGENAALAPLGERAAGSWANRPVVATPVQHAGDPSGQHAVASPAGRAVVSSGERAAAPAAEGGVLPRGERAAVSGGESAAVAPGEVVDEFGTGFLRTRVRRYGRGFLWERSAGELRREPFSPVSDEVRAAVAAVAPEPAPGVAGVLPVLGVPQDGARRYPAGAARSVGHLLLSALDARQRGLLHHLLYEVGRTVRRVHEGVPVRLAAGRPRGAARLASWLRTPPSPEPSPTPSPDAPHEHLPNLHALAVRRLGPARLARVLGWCDELAVGRDGDVFLLGGVGSGALVPGAAPGAGVLLAGEELARGPAAYDVGWLLGELAEFRLVHLTRPEHADLAEHCAEAARSFLRGYGDHRTDPVALGRAAALRVFTHAHDYAAYVGWTDEFPAYLDCIAELIDTDGTAAVRPTTLETG